MERLERQIGERKIKKFEDLAKSNEFDLGPDDFLRLKNRLPIKAVSKSDFFCFKSRELMEITKSSNDLKHKFIGAETMLAETKEIDYVMEAASGPHFSGLRLDSLMSAAASSSSPRSSSTPTTTAFSTPLADSSALKQPFVIGVSGGTASGKTTVCDMIIQQLHDHRVVLVNQDSFYRGLTPEELQRVHEYNFDHPDAFDTEQLLECVHELKSGHSVHVPMYDFKTHQRSSDSFRQVNASDVIILEGILVFHDQRVRNLMNMKIFVDTG
ncbi:Uridine kinase-like protein 1 [Forsythia ovata]|uniref:uridine/cytidine kinase n=1 Tax=Forsythia ovata TaxID=205694 RepID=A0ABD1UF58_9LAMI